MRLPTYEEFSRDERQLEVLECPLDQSLFVVGPPGSGKTVLAVRRAEMLAEYSIATSASARRVRFVSQVVTYNRMLRRLLGLLGSSDRVEPRTMHSFVWSDYSHRTGQSPPQFSEYEYSWTAILGRLAQQDQAPAEWALVVDEGQDLPKEFFEYARLARRRMTVFADEDQALNEKRTTLQEIKETGQFDDPIVLCKNHRNVPEIARVAQHFHRGRLPAAEVCRSPSGELPGIRRSSSIGDTAARIANWHRTRGGSIGVVVFSNATGRIVQRELEGKMSGDRVDFYTNDRKNEDQIDVSASGVTVLNKESAKGQEFDTVFVLELERFVPCRRPVEFRVMYMTCSRARDNLFLIHGPEALSTEAGAALPGSELLERL